MCGYPYEQDMFISGHMLLGHAWEPKMSERFQQAFLQGNSSNDMVFVDFGINVGAHGLFMLQSGCRVFGVDPITTNLLRVKIALIECT